MTFMLKKTQAECGILLAESLPPLLLLPGIKGPRGGGGGGGGGALKALYHPSAERRLKT